MNENNKMNAMLDKSTDEFIDFDKLEAQLEDELEAVSYTHLTLPTILRV